MAITQPKKTLEGRQIRLVKCNDSFSITVPGTAGTVVSVNDNGTLTVKWSDGSETLLDWAAGDRWTILS